MNNRGKKIGMLAAALAIVALLAFGSSVFAQGPAPQGTPPAFGLGYGMGLGRIGGGVGPQNSLVAVAAQVMGISQTDLVAALDGGKTIADVAKDKGIATSKGVDAFIATRAQALKTAVDAKRLTQAEADQLLATMKANVTAQLSSKFTPRGPGMGAGFVDANHDGICDHQGTNAQLGPRGRWSR